MDTHTGSSSASTHRKREKRRPLLVLGEDDEEIRFGLTALFAHDGFDVTGVGDGKLLVECLHRLRREGRTPDVIVTDHRMPGYTATQILEGLRDGGWNVPVIVITAFGAEVRTRAEDLGACAVFDKPFDPDDLRTVVRWWSASGRRSMVALQKYRKRGGRWPSPRDS